MDNPDDILVEFIIEAREILDQLDLDFLLLEKTPDDKKLVGNIFRAIHTLKGSSGFFAFKRLEKVTHAGETLLGKIRDGSFELDKQKQVYCLIPWMLSEKLLLALRPPIPNQKVTTASSLRICSIWPMGWHWQKKA